MDTEDSVLEAEDVEQDLQAELEPQVRHGDVRTIGRFLVDKRQETTASEGQNQPFTANAGTTAPPADVFAAMPQIMLGTGAFRHDSSHFGQFMETDTLTVQDESLKNIMMSWYYAGYYTGLHAGQQLPANAPPQQ